MSSHALIIAGNLPGSTCALMTVDARVLSFSNHVSPSSLSLFLSLSLSAYRLCITAPQQIESCALFTVHRAHLTTPQFNRRSRAPARCSRKHRTQPADMLARPRITVPVELVMRRARWISESPSTWYRISRQRAATLARR